MSLDRRGAAHRAKMVAAAGSLATFLVALVGFARQGEPRATTQVQAGDVPSVSPTVPTDPFSSRFDNGFDNGFGSGRPGRQFGNLEPHTTTRGS